MSLVAMIKDWDNRVLAALVGAGLIVVLDGVSLVWPLVRPPSSTLDRTPARPPDIVVPTPPSEPPRVSWRPAGTGAVTFKVCIGGLPTDCPDGVIFVRCGDNNLARWAEHACGRYTIDGLAGSQAGQCKRANVKVNCFPIR